MTVTGTLGPIGNSSVSGRLTSPGEFLMVSGGTLNVEPGGELHLAGDGAKTLAGGAVLTVAARRQRRA